MEHEAQEAFYLDPHFYVLAAFVIFVLLAGRAICGFIAGVLDARSHQIKAELDAARALRIEAEQVLAEYKQKQAEYLKEAQLMFERAQNDAFAISTRAEKDLHATLDERTRNAVAKIAQEETNAIAEVRNHIVDVSLAAARAVIVEQMSATSQESLLALAIADIERKIH